MSNETWLIDLNKELRTVGKLPRIFNATLALVSLLVVWAGWVASGNTVMAVVFAALPVSLAVLALPVRAHATNDSLIVRSYLTTRQLQFSDVTTFIDMPYSGVWNRFSGTDGWLNLRLRMIEVALNSGREVPLPATMCSPRVCARMVELLNARVINPEPP